MLVSKIKPCRCKYELNVKRNCEWLIKSVLVYLVSRAKWITVAIPELIHAISADFGRRAFIGSKPTGFARLF